MMLSQAPPEHHRPHPAMTPVPSEATTSKSEDVASLQV